MKWTLIIVGVLVVASIALALVGVKSGKHPSAAGIPSPTSGTGSRSDPIPVGTAAAVGGGWKVRILRTDPNANRILVATKNPFGSPNKPPPPGARDFLVELSLAYVGGGKGDAAVVRDLGLHVEGAHNAGYDLTSDSCAETIPAPSLMNATTVFSGQSVRGNVCFQIASNDAKTLELYTGFSGVASDILGLKGLGRIWFALR